MKVKLTAQILGMYVGMYCDVLDTDGEFLYTGRLPFPNLDYWTGQMYVLRPNLRRLESITEDECKECYYLSTGHSWGKATSCKGSWWREKDDYYATNSNIIKGVPAAWLYLLSRGFDLFGLIDEGLAKEVSE